MLVRDLLNIIEDIAPRAYQENYDNSGLLAGSMLQEVHGILVCLDCTEAVVQEAIDKKCNVVLAHHPVIFGGLKKLTDSNDVERTVVKAIKHDIALIACHTNLDNVAHGVNAKIAEKLRLEGGRILLPKDHMLSKLVVYIPQEASEKVRMALFEAGCGHIGNYSHAGFSDSGIGTFKGNEASNPRVGQKNQIEQVQEIKFETIFPSYLHHKVVAVLKQNHPYEEVAYHILPMSNANQYVGAGMIGTLPQEMEVNEFLSHVKNSMGLQALKYTGAYRGKVRKVSVCGGSGSFLLKHAMTAGADAYISADFRYHEYFQSEDKMLVVDIGHYESEVFTKDLLIEHLSKKITTFAPLLSEINTNPIKYFY